MQSRNARSCVGAVGLAVVLGLGSHAPEANAQQKPPPSSAATKSADTVHPTKAVPTISRDSARLLLLARIAGATVVSQRLMLKDGRQIYSFRVREKGKPATARVIVDATTGDVKR